VSQTSNSNKLSDAFEQQVMLNPEKEEHTFDTQFLNVDDEKGILRMHERLFKKSNLELNCCKNGVETVRLLRCMNFKE